MLRPKTYVKGFHDDEKVNKMKYRQLGQTDMIVSTLSIGSSPFASFYGDVEDIHSYALVEHAIKAGINMVDTAYYYGQGKAESVLGQILPKLPREAFYVNTKVGRYEEDVRKQFDFSAERTLQSVDESLQRLGLDYVDVIQVHDIEFADSPNIIINETLPALQKIKDEGKARYIGITGYPLKIYKEIIEKSKVKVDCILSYTHYTLNDTSLLDILPYLKEKGVGIINASPVSMGLLTHQGPPAFHPALNMENSSIRENCAAAAKYCQEQEVDITKLALHFALSNNDVHTTLVGVRTIEEIDKNLNTVYIGLTSQEKTVLEYILDRFMKPLNNMNWGDMEVEDFRKEVMKTK